MQSQLSVRGIVHNILTEISDKKKKEQFRIDSRSSIEKVSFSKMVTCIT